MISISYGITVCNEHEELNDLLDQLINNIDTSDEILILQDISNTTELVTNIILKYQSICFDKNIRFSHIIEELNRDFSTFKNNLIKYATKEYLFQLDADELLSKELILNIKAIIECNKDIDVYMIPRANIVHGITHEHLIKWGWHMNEKGYINWPDPQSRLFKLKNKSIQWKNSVHEQLKGYQLTTILPFKDVDYLCILHVKDISKQEKQNQFYQQITNQHG